MVSLVWLFAAVQAATVAIDEEKNHPVTKVVNLIKDMQAQLAKEQKEDEEVYEKVSCWCTVNDKAKTSAIAGAEAKISDLTAAIEEGTAASARLNTEIKNLEGEIAKSQAALDKATGIRQKELGEFNGEEKDVLQSIGALKSAVTVLSKHTSFVQIPSNTLLNIAVMVQSQFHKHGDILKSAMTPSQRKVVSAFVEAPSDYFDADPTFKQSYAPQSGQVLGILKQMLETFQDNLSSSQKEEMLSQQAHADLKAAKTSEIKAGQDQRDKKVQDLANTDEKTSNDKQDLEDTRNTLSADQKFLLNLKTTCQLTDEEWAERQKARQIETEACSEALAILIDDKAQDTFSKTLSFIEKSQAHNAASLLDAAANKFQNPRLSTLADRIRMDAFARVEDAIDGKLEDPILPKLSGKKQLATIAMKTKLDNFVKVTESMEGMINDLKKEMAGDVKKKDYCNDAIHKNEMAQALKSRDIEELEAEIADLTSSISQLTKDLAELDASMEEMKVQMKRAGEDRELENNDFQATVADQRSTVQLLQQALEVLKPVYAKKFLQTSQTKQSGPPPPSGFKEYKQQGGGGVMGMIETIISDAKTLEKEAIKAEGDAQKAYESFVKDTNHALEVAQRSYADKSEEKSLAEADKVTADKAHEAATSEQEQNINENADLHKSCDFLLGNFDLRQSTMSQEIEAIEQAKAVIHGGAGYAFLQKQ
jgi:hypothetical protein